jgi:hypothetical protein
VPIQVDICAQREIGDISEASFSRLKYRTVERRIRSNCAVLPRVLIEDATAYCHWRYNLWVDWPTHVLSGLLLMGNEFGLFRMYSSKRSN